MAWREGYWGRLESGKIHLATEDEEIDEIPETAYESDDWIEVPDFRDLGCGRDLVFDFVARQLPSEADRVYGIFRSSGAYGRYKDLLDSRALLDEWFGFENSRREEAIRAWCREIDMELTEDGNDRADTDTHA